MNTIRDFIYLDSERVRSFAAQLLGGVPDTATTESGHEVGVGASGEAGFWRVVRAQGEADYRYHRSASETRSLHHRVYVLLEEALEKDGFFRTLDASFDFTTWSPDSLRDGDFVKAAGDVRIVDYAQTFASMQLMPKLMKALQTIQKMNIQSRAASGEISQSQAERERQELGRMAQEVKALPIAEMVSVAEELYAEGDVRIKVRPTGAPARLVLVGNGRKESLLENTSPLALLQEASEDSHWVVVGQVSRPSESRPALLSGNQMEDALEGIALALDELTHVASAAVFPAMSFTPLAIYREVRPA